MMVRPLRFLVSLFAGLAALAAGTVAAQPARAGAGQLGEAMAAVRAIVTMRADFVQTDSAGRQVGGVLTLKRPRKLRFQYRPGYPVLLVSDGHALVMIDYEVRQVQRWPLRYTPVGALLDPGGDVSQVARLGPGGDPDTVTVLIHDPRHRESGDMTILLTRNKVAPGGLELTGWATVDAQNQRTTVRLSHQRYGIEVSDDVFRWTDPRKAGPK